MSGKKQPKGTIVIKKEEVVEGGHHGGAWKVAYADFVTAMMAFFLLMWLLNATTAKQKRGLADYFSPNNLMARTTSGYGAPFGGRTPNSDGALASDRGMVQVTLTDPAPLLDIEDEDGSERPQPRDDSGGPKQVKPDHPAPDAPDAPQTRTPLPTDRPDRQADLAQRERAAFERAAAQIRQAVQDDPALADIARQLAIDITPEGLRIQIIDEDHLPMFATGSAVLNDRARALLTKVGPVLQRLPEPVAIAGHTDAAVFKGGERTNWDLSADRANSTRRVLAEAGLPEARIRSVTGNADRDPLLPGDPMAAANRRIAITVLRAAPAR